MRKRVNRKVAAKVPATWKVFLDSDPEFLLVEGEQLPETFGGGMFTGKVLLFMSLFIRFSWENLLTFKEVAAIFNI